MQLMPKTGFVPDLSSIILTPLIVTTPSKNKDYKIVLDLPFIVPYDTPLSDAGWSSLEARRAHNPKVVGSNPTPATTFKKSPDIGAFFIFRKKHFVNGK
ncbi:MAG: Unknown protein [uncultured Thiotrichaceae bacterium]|uniref:Uncharacterized protein n=1 Tax=uncultured Thiotrichaceae bacterium TaxID=298394 RepID=A0A6S6S9C3_9GAMM|nr:MAG: Unknown protein [uncultured Thiotrichaceae bacterium]